MVEAIFISTVIFAVYVIYRVTDESKKKGGSEGETQAAAPAAESAKPKAETSKPAAKPKPKPKPAAPKAKADKPAAKAEPASNAASKEVRNPETGETATIPSNYRFTKRWIKEAMVSEGLLDKIYKNNELDDEASAKVKEALEKFRALDKYQP